MFSTTHQPRPQLRAARCYGGAQRKLVLVRSNVSSSSETDATARPRLVPVPEGPAQQTAQAAAAVEAAVRAGVKLQRLELALPLIGATDLDDWPGGIRQQFKAASPLVENILRSLKQLEELRGPLSVEIWDQGDAVGAWTGEKLAAVLFPTASVLPKLRKLAQQPGLRTLIIVNPQWETAGNLVSDFGFGQSKADAEAFIESFQPTYYQKTLRVYGDNIRVLRSFPGPWQVHVLDQRNRSELIGTKDAAPSTADGPVKPVPYREVEDMLRARPSSSMNKSLAERLRDEWQFVKNSLNTPP